VPFHILLVEDDRPTPELIASLLNTRDRLADTAEEGFSALPDVRGEPYHRVLVHCHLPEIDAHALERFLHAQCDKTDSGLEAMDCSRLMANRDDAIFDRVVARAIEPKALLDLLEKVFPRSTTATEELDTFLSESATNSAQSAAQVLWRLRGIESLPSAAVFPAPSAAERARLEYCFRLVDADSADCLLLLRSSGLPEVSAVRASGNNYLQPLFAVGEVDTACSELHFRVDDGNSWSSAASRLLSFAERRRRLKPEVLDAATLEARLAAYLFVADRSLALQRDKAGRASIPYTGGFAAAAVVEAIKKLAAHHLVEVRPNTTEQGARELCVRLNEKGVASVTGAEESTAGEVQTAFMPSL
jgi:CheY-like chemotaxis protein